MSSVRFFVMAKPDAVRRGLTGEIVSRFEKRGFMLEKIRLVDPVDYKITMEDHYAEHRGKAFYDGLINFSLSGRVCLMIWNGNIQVARSLIGSTLPWDAKPGTIRGDYSHDTYQLANVSDRPIITGIHASGDEADAKKEIKIWFKPEEIYAYSKADSKIHYRKGGDTL